MKLFAIAAAGLLTFAGVSSCKEHGHKHHHNDHHHHKRTQAPGLEKIKHVILFMQENRSFDMYYGTMAGVENFASKDIGIQDNGLNLLYQPCSTSPDKKNGTSYLLPFNFKGNRAGCTPGGSNGWTANHKAINGGKNNNWPDGNSKMSMGYLTRDQIPMQFTLAESFTILDNYHQSVTASTNPNRVFWMSGTIQDPKTGYTLEDNTETPGLDWETYPQALTRANVTWQVYQDNDNFDDNPLAWFTYWRNLPAGPEKQKGTGFLGLNTFYQQAANGTLPEVSIIVGPTELSEHPNNTPAAGAWLQGQVVNAVMNSPLYKESVLLINYDESGGFYDHVVPPQMPQDKWVTDKFVGGKAPLGMGPRVPMTIISPFHRGGHVFSEVADHSSCLQFLEEWVGKLPNGSYAAPAVNLDPWFRNVSSNLVASFDFNNPDYSIPTLPNIPKPSTDSSGAWDPTQMCEALSDPKSSPPFGNQTYPQVEKGSKALRGNNVSKRHVAFVKDGSAIEMSGTHVFSRRMMKRGVDGLTSGSHFVMVPAGNGKQYRIQSATDASKCINVWGSGVQLGECKGTLWEASYQTHGGAHTLRNVGTGKYLSVHGNEVKLVEDPVDANIKLYSVTV
ncbi:phosphoesterase family-domain-containing protein [Gongronella butleri]|nr:phosphoesterase family-domain-containing protein [Gongronella butleri]